MTKTAIKINEERFYLLFTDDESELFKNVLFRMSGMYSGVFSAEEELYNRGYTRLYLRDFLKDMYGLVQYKPDAVAMYSKYEARIKRTAKYLMFLHKEGLLDFDYSFLDKFPKQKFHQIYVKSGLTYAFEIFLKELGYNVGTSQNAGLPSKTQKEFNELKFFKYNGAFYFEPKYNDAFKEYETIKLSIRAGVKFVHKYKKKEYGE
jgi:hypothetical protein